MGLFDGAAGRGDFASTAHVARLTGSPVILVVGAAGTSRSIAATVHGFAGWDPQLRLAGVVLNQVSSDRHEALLREALAPLNIPVVGALRRDDALHTPSRHLGLVPAGERPASVDAWLPALRALVQRDLDLDLLMRIARSAPGLAAEPWSAEPGYGAPPMAAARPGDGQPPTPRGARPARVAVAAGPAFTFRYAEHDELLAAAGAEVVPFDPLTAEKLPDGTEALVAGGGFPQVHADALAANTALLDDVRGRAAAGMPVRGRVRGPAVARRVPGRAQAVRRPACPRPDGTEADPRLPGSDRAARHAAAGRRYPGPCPRVPPHGQ